MTRRGREGNPAPEAGRSAAPARAGSDNFAKVMMRIKFTTTWPAPKLGLGSRSDPELTKRPNTITTTENQTKIMRSPLHYLFNVKLLAALAVVAARLAAAQDLNLTVAPNENGSDNFVDVQN